MIFKENKYINRKINIYLLSNTNCKYIVKFSFTFT